MPTTASARASNARRHARRTGPTAAGRAARVIAPDHERNAVERRPDGGERAARAELARHHHVGRESAQRAEHPPRHVQRRPLLRRLLPVRADAPTERSPRDDLHVERVAALLVGAGVGVLPARVVGGAQHHAQLPARRRGEVAVDRQAVGREDVGEQCDAHQ
jgi:hypothetical protein